MQQQTDQPTQTNQPRFCVECANSTPGRFDFLCAHPRSPRDIVYGSPTCCAEMRADPSLCGPQGDWFKRSTRLDPAPVEESILDRIGAAAGYVAVNVLPYVALGALLYFVGTRLVSWASVDQPEQVRDAGGQRTDEQPQQPAEGLPRSEGPSLLPQMVRPISKSARAVWG